MAARHGCIQVELATLPAPVLGGGWRQDLQPFEQRTGLGAATRFHAAGDDIHALGLPLARGVEHGVGLPHTCGRPEENLQLAAPGLRLAHLCELRQRTERMVFHLVPM